VKVIYYFVAGLCAAASLGALFYTIYWNVLPFMYLLIINGVLVAAMRWFAAKAGLGTKSAFLYIALLWPGVGTLLLYLVSVFSRGRAEAGEQLRDYEKYIEGLQIAHAFHPRSAAEVDTEVNIMAGGDVMRFATPTYKKEFMIEVEGQEIPKMAGVLRRALLDDDPEVRHYAAAMLAAHSDRFEKEIQLLKDKVRREPALLLSLCDLYERYISSGFMATSIRQEFSREYLSLLWQGKELFPKNYGLEVRLLQALIEQSMYTEARQVLLDLAESFPGRAFPILLEMRLEFSQGQYQKVAALALKIRESGWAVPETHKHVVDYWV